MRRSSNPSVVVTLLALLTGVASGQCPDGWRAGDSLPGVDGAVYAMTTWDPDGNGAQPELLIVGGSFSVAGRVLANNIASWDGEQWRALGAGAGGETGTQVNALAVMDGLLVAGGRFTHAGTASASNIATWNGSNWQPLNSGVRNGGIAALLEFNGDLIAAGWFTFAGSVIANRIARWDGVAWSALGEGTDGSITALSEYNGDVIAGGYFTNAGGAPAQRAARWDGSAWHAMNLPNVLGIDNLIVHSGALVATVWQDVFGCPAGAATGCGDNVGGVHQWNGSAWQPLADWDSSYSLKLAVHDGQLFASYSQGSCFGGCSEGIRVLQGSRWQEFASPWTANAFAEYNGELISANGGEVAAWDGTTLHPLGESGKRLFGLGTYAGAVVAGFATNSTIEQQYGVAYWNGHRWQALSGAFDGPVNVLTTWKGDLVVGGHFGSIDGEIVRGIARRDATGAWHSLEGLEFCGLSGCGEVKDLVEFNGDLIAGGAFRITSSPNSRSIARWDGAQWHAISTSMDGPSQEVNALAVFGGALIVGGGFHHIDGVAANHIARWNGAQWQPLGAGIGVGDLYYTTVNDLIVLDGLLFVAGRFDHAGNGFARKVAAWNGTIWSYMGDGLGSFGEQEFANTLAILEGDLVVGGVFSTTAGGAPVSNLARFDGVVFWHQIDGGANNEVTNAFAQADQLFISGPFSVAGDQPSAGWAIHGPTCPTGDITLDGVVDVDDLVAVILAWGPCPAFPALCPADVDGSGAVDVDDLIAVILTWAASS